MLCMAILSGFRPSPVISSTTDRYMTSPAGKGAGMVTLKVIAAAGCGVEVGPAGDAGSGTEVGELIPGILSNESEQALSKSPSRLTRQSSLRVEELTK
jgi:hypothetical protein